MARLLLLSVLVLSAMFIQVSLAVAQDHGTSVGFAPPELEPRPPKGIGAVIAGAGLVVFAAESAVLMAFCDGGGLLFTSERTCLTFGGTVGAISLTAGITALTIGVIRRKRYKAWRAAQPMHALESLRLTPIAAGGTMSWSLRF